MLARHLQRAENESLQAILPSDGRNGFILSGIEEPPDRKPEEIPAQLYREACRVRMRQCIWRPIES